MDNLTKFEFVALDIFGKTYLTGVLDAEIHLNAMNLGNTIKDGSESSDQEKAKSTKFIRYLNEGSKSQYIIGVKDSNVLWNNLKERYDHHKSVMLPKTRYEWMHLGLQDFKTPNEYNSAMFKIVYQLNLCGDNVTKADMLEKKRSLLSMPLIWSYNNNIVKVAFKKYFELIYGFLVTEQNNELLMKNHNSHPTGSEAYSNASFHEVNANNFKSGHGRGHVYGRGPNQNHVGLSTKREQKW